MELVVLLAQDLDRAKSFVARELGPAAAASTAATELRDTVAAYLRHDRSLVRAAAELHVARNTVAYRVKRFHEGVADATWRSAGSNSKPHCDLLPS